MRAPTFRYCEVCGAHGHDESKCALRELNAQQERQARVSHKNIRLGLTPALEAEIAKIREQWGIECRVQ